MAPINEQPCVSTDNLILPSPRKFYRAYMHAGHWQLRAFVHSPKPHLVHYLGWNDIYEVNTATKVRKIIATLPFSPRSFTSENGLLCCGGDNGKFCTYDMQAVTRGQRAMDEAEIEVKVFGKHLLNCINLWFPHEDAEDGAHTSPVAVIASNDKHIYIVDVATKDLIQKLPHGEPVNMGKISPDGALLVVVGDDPYMHVYKRKRIAQNQTICSASNTWEWEKFSQTILPGQRLRNTEDMRGSFAASFTHRYVAIGTQYGDVAVFEVDALKESHYPQPAVVFQSTRPNTKEGAIRSLQFNPSSSLDLLAITEDGGRVAVVDVRQFGKRQTLEVNRESGYQRVKLVENIGGPSHTAHPSSAAADADTTDDESAYRNSLVRQARAQARVMRNLTPDFDRPDVDAFLLHGNHQLAPEHVSVLLALQSNRRRREREAEAASTAASGPGPASGEPVRRGPPRSNDRIRAITERIGDPNPARTAAALDRARATHMAVHNMDLENRAARRRAAGQEITEAEMDEEAIATRNARLMAEMMAIDAANLRSRDEALRQRASFFDPESLRERGMHRTANTVVRVRNHLQQADLLDRARRERNGEEGGPELPYLPLALRTPLERQEPSNAPLSPPPEAGTSLTVRLPADIDPAPRDTATPSQASRSQEDGPRYRHRMPSIWADTMRSIIGDPDAARADSNEENPTLSPETTLALLQQRREARERERRERAWDRPHDDLDNFEGLSPERRQALLDMREASQRRHARERARQSRVPSVWGGPTMRSLIGDPDDTDESMSPEERQASQQMREARERVRRAREMDFTRRQQSRDWISPGGLAHSMRELPYVVEPVTVTEENQTTGCAWSPDGRTLYVGTEGGLYEYQVNVQNRRVHPAFQLR